MTQTAILFDGNPEHFDGSPDLGPALPYSRRHLSLGGHRQLDDHPRPRNTEPLESREILGKTRNPRGSDRTQIFVSKTQVQMVEMGRIELPSDDVEPKTSPGAVCYSLFSAPALTQTSC